MTGETITITLPGKMTVNAYGEQTPASPTTLTVSNVIVGPYTQTDSTDTQRPYGTGSSLMLYFPRSWQWRSLRNATVRLSGSESVWRVVGDPRPIVTNLTPTSYLPVGVQITTEEG